MRERDGYIAGVPSWVDTTQPDPAAAVDFYSGLFGWEFEDVMPPDSEGSYFIGRLHGGDVAVGSIPLPPTARNTYVAVDSADETRPGCAMPHGRVVMEPFDVGDSRPDADVFTDLEGALICVWQAKEFKGAQIVNEPGSLNFNNLHTRDVEGAKSFYGSVRLGDAGTGRRGVGRCPATATTSSATTLTSASGSPSPAVRMGSRTSWRASTGSRRTSPTFRRTGA